MSDRYDEEAEHRLRANTEARGDCLVWTGKSLNNRNQPLLDLGVVDGKRRRVVAARWLYERDHGPLPAGTIMRPTCDTTNCIRHTRPGTQADLDRWSDQSAWDRFWNRVAKVESDGCWEWQGSKFWTGYGQVTHRGRNQSAHRVSWQLTYGPIPSGGEICHRCDNPPCVRPDHLFLGDRAVNAADMAAKGRAARIKPNAKLTVEQVRAMRERYAAGGISFSKLAAEFGVTAMTAHRAVTRQSFSDVA
jgi:hypothetical protein